MNYSEILSHMGQLDESQLRSLNSAVIGELKARRNQEAARKRHLFGAGDKVSWNGRNGYTEGTIVRVKRKKAIVRVNATRSTRMINWDVPLNMLNAVGKQRG
jgi:hypothetical protein